MRRLLIFVVHLAVLLHTACADEYVERPAQLGPVKAVIRLEPAEPVIGDPVTLTIRVTADSGVELLMPEFGEALDRFTVLDFVPRQTIDDHGRTVATQTYRLQPPLSGIQVIRPILIEFVDRRTGERPAPPGQDAYELLTERVEFEVKSVLSSGVEAEIRPPLGPLNSRADGKSNVWMARVFVCTLLAVLTPLAILGLLAWRRRARRRSAYEIARIRLERLLANPHLDAEHVGKFFVQLSGIVRRYLEDRFELRAPELTTEEFLASVGEGPVLSLEHQRLLREFLRQADLVKFAGLVPDEHDIQRSVDAARQFLEETRENAPMLDVEADVEPAEEKKVRETVS